MSNEFRFVQYERPARRRLEVGQVFGWGICAIAVTYLFAAALLGLLAG